MKCKYCGKEFIPKSNNHRFCSLECNKQIWNSSGSKKQYYENNKDKSKKQHIKWKKEKENNA